jgi:hypothetical protein
MASCTGILSPNCDGPPGVLAVFFSFQVVGVSLAGDARGKRTCREISDDRHRRQSRFSGVSLLHLAGFALESPVLLLACLA